MASFIKSSLVKFSFHSFPDRTSDMMKAVNLDGEENFDAKLV
jgi:hypothetical protein